MAHDHDHDDHDHDHAHGSELSEMQSRVRALESILTEKGYVEPAALDAIIEAYETKIGPHNGARVVAKAWTDPAFKEALLEDFFFQAEDGIRDLTVTGVQTCALPI